MTKIIGGKKILKPVMAGIILFFVIIITGLWIYKKNFHIYPVKKEKVNITGQVTDNKKEEPLEGVTVTAATITSVTDEKGSYSLKGVPAGEIRITVSKKNYIKESFTINVSEDTLHNITLQYKEEVSIAYSTTVPEDTEKPSTPVPEETKKPEEENPTSAPILPSPMATADIVLPQSLPSPVPQLTFPPGPPPEGPGILPPGMPERKYPPPAPNPPGPPPPPEVIAADIARCNEYITKTIMPLYEKGEYEEAVKECYSLIFRHKHYYISHLWMAKCLLAVNEAEEAKIYIDIGWKLEANQTGVSYEESQAKKLYDIYYNMPIKQ